jgi:hypothetical protein
MQINLVDLAVGSSAVWRITHLFHAEDGPWDLFARLRRLAGQSVWGKMLDCFYCSSVWAAVPIAAAIGHTWTERILLLPALSGAAIVIERAVPRPAPLAEWYFEAEQAKVKERTI